MTLKWRRNFAVAKLDLGREDIKVVTINIRSVKLHTPEPLCPDIDGDGGDRDSAATNTTTGDTTITDPVYIKVLVAHPMTKTPSRSLYLLTEAGRLVVGAVLAHVMDESNVEMPPTPPLP